MKRMAVVISIVLFATIGIAGLFTICQFYNWETAAVKDSAVIDGVARSSTVANERCGELVDWSNWKDPLEPIDMQKFYKEEEEVRSRLGEKTREALKPIMSSVRLAPGMTFLGMTFGSRYPINEKGEMCISSGVVCEYFPTVALDKQYFPFHCARRHLSPVSHRLFKLCFFYCDYDHGGPNNSPRPIGRYRSGKELLDEGRAVLADIEAKTGVPLQAFQLTKPVWPYRPGVKRSRAWSGKAPECYLCDEKDWVVARHAEAISHTVSGDYSIVIKLKITYYDEYTISLTITDNIELMKSRAEHEELKKRTDK